MDAPLYLSDRAIDGLAVAPSRLRAALRRAFALHAGGQTIVEPKRMLPIAPGHFFQSLCAASAELGYAAHKWVGVAAENAAQGLATVNSLVVLSDFSSGMPRAVLDGNRLTVLRTAALSALAAEFLARPDSQTIGFIGCGRQAEGHLHALRDLLPGLMEAICVSGGTASAERLAATARAHGLDARTTTDPEAALACDVVVTSVRHGAGLRPFLDARLLRPGSFVAAVDLGASWMPETLRSLDVLATDDRAQADEPSTRARLGFDSRFDCDLAELASGAAIGGRDRMNARCSCSPVSRSPTSRSRSRSWKRRAERALASTCPADKGQGGPELAGCRPDQDCQFGAVEGRWIPACRTGLIVATEEQMGREKSTFERRRFLALAATPILAAPFVGSALAQGGTESVFDRITRTKTIRVAGLPGELPFFNKDLVSGKWSGACVEMMNDIAKQLGGFSVEYLDSTYGNSVLQVQAGQIDLAFALNATPQRALAIDFTRAVFNHGFGICSKPEFRPKTWGDINKPEVKIAVDLGSSQEAAARRFAPKADITALKTRDEVVLSLASGRVQCAVFAALVGLTAMKKNPAIGTFTMLQGPIVSLPSNIGVRKEADRRWRDFLDVWIDFNRGTGQIREWLIGGLTPAGLTIDDVPPEVTF